MRVGLGLGISLHRPFVGGSPTPTPTPAPAFTTQPSISDDGTPTVGETLTGNDGTVSNGGTVTGRSWLFNGSAISGANGGSYVPTQAGDYQFQNTGTGGIVAISAARTVAAAPAPTPTPSPTTSQSDTTVGSSVFSFASPALVGSYADGIDDKFIASAVSISGVTPNGATTSGNFAAPDTSSTYTNRRVHGLMQNPSSGGVTGGNIATDLQAFDSLDSNEATSGSTILDYNHALNKDPTVTGVPLTSGTLVKAVSNLTPNIAGRDMVMELNQVHIVASPPPLNAFPPHGSDTVKESYFSTADLDLSVLPSVAPQGADLPTYAEVQARLKVVQTFFTNNLFTRGINPTAYQRVYGADIALDTAQAMLFCCLNTTTAPQRLRVATMLCRIGIDIWRMTANGGRWPSINASFGGGHAWVKPLLVFAARLLRNASNVTARASIAEYADAAQRNYFQSDRVHYIVNREVIESSSKETAYSPYPAPHLHFMENAPDWVTKPSNFAGAGANFTSRYRGINAHPHLAAMLAIRMIGAEATWNSDTTFAYMDRYFNWWQRQGSPTGDYFSTLDTTSFLSSMVTAYWPAYAARYLNAVAPSLVRTVVRDNLMWFEFDKLLDTRFVPAASAFAATVAGSPVALPSATTNMTTTTAAATAQTATVASAAGIVVGMPVSSANLPAGTYVTAISGTTVTLSEPATGAGLASATFSAVHVFGYSLAVVLPVAVTAGQAATLAYTAPGSNFTRGVGGGAVTSLGATAATNKTGELPAGATATETVYTGPTAATRQYSGAPAPASLAIKRLRMSLRFWLGSKTANDTIMSNIDGSNTNWKLYFSTLTDLRLTYNNVSLRMPGAGSALPLNKIITMHLILDLTGTSYATMYRAEFRWDGGSHIPSITGSTGVTDGSSSPNIATLFSGGMFLGAIGSGSSAMSGGFSELTIGWGDAAYALPADYSGPQFAWNAAWGTNGQNVWGQNQRYYGGTVDDWNGSVINRGNGGAAAMTPRRLDASTEDLVTSYVVAAI